MPRKSLVRYFRVRRKGPEAALEKAVALRAHDLFPSRQHLLWLGASLEVGAGMPDLLIVACPRWVSELPKMDRGDVRILAFLRSVSRAASSTIAEGTGLDQRAVERRLGALTEASALRLSGRSYRLQSRLRDVLPEIVAVEAKVHDWRGAIAQAARNRVLAHRTYIALPEQVAHRIAAVSDLSTHGVGLLAVRGETVTEFKSSPRRRPLVWSYYYGLVSTIARTGVDSRRGHGIRVGHRRG